MNHLRLPCVASATKKVSTSALPSVNQLVLWVDLCRFRMETSYVVMFVPKTPLCGA